MGSRGSLEACLVDLRLGPKRHAGHGEQVQRGGVGVYLMLHASNESSSLALQYQPIESMSP